MKQPPNAKLSYSSSDKTKIILVSIFLVILLVILGVLVGLVLRRGGFQLAAPASPTVVIPTLFVPTPDCGSPTLVIGTTTFQIQNLTPAADGSLIVPPGTSGVAYWVEGTDHNYAFVLSPTPDNVAFMSTITPGTTAKATWKNCNSTTYTLSVPQPGSFNASALPDQSKDGITIFFPSDATGAGSVFNGELAEELINTFDTPAANEMQAEIGLLETTTSSDKTTITVGVSIHNYGASPITLSASDVSLVQTDSTALAMVNSEPGLPKDVAPSATETVHFTFRRPVSPTATLKIFTVEYDIEGY